MDIIEMAYAIECFDKEERMQKRHNFICDNRGKVFDDPTEFYVLLCQYGLGDATDEEISEIKREINGWGIM